MECRNCGSVVPDDAKFCTSCGTALNTEEVMSVNKVDSSRFSEFKKANAKDHTSHGMKWFKFIIYFQLFFSAFLYGCNALALFFGWFYVIDGSNYQTLIYLYYPIMKFVDYFIAFSNLALLVYSFYVRQSLAKFKTNAIKLYFILYYVSITVSLVYIVVSSLVSGANTLTVGVVFNLTVSIAMIAINKYYFSKRNQLFIN